MSQRREATPAWLLLTGLPGSGKTTIIRDAVSQAGSRCGGFYTEELRQGSTRQGFMLKTLDGKEAVLSHIAHTSGPRVGKYGVDTRAMSRVGIPAVEAAWQQGLLVVIDEIGKMELRSGDFRRLLDDLAASKARLLGTIMRNPNREADRYKALPFVRVLEVRPDTRVEVLDQVLEWLGGSPS